MPNRSTHAGSVSGRIVPLLLWASLGCAPGSDDPADAPSEEAASAPSQDLKAPTQEAAEDPPSPWTREGLADPLRRYLEPAAGPPEWQPGATPWEEVPVARHLQADAPGHDSPAELLLAHTAQGEGRAMGLGQDAWEVTLRVLPHDGDPTVATGVIQVWGYKDDSLEGRDLRLHLEEGEEGWFVTKKERRLHCRRGVTDDHLCV